MREGGSSTAEARNRDHSQKVIRPEQLSWPRTCRSFTAALTGGNIDFPAFLRSERRKNGNCSFTADLNGGKVDLPVFLRSERRKSGKCSFTAVLIGGKVDFPAFLRSERRKTENCRYAAGTYGGNLSIRFFILSSLLLLVGGSWVEA
ncbi:hypothetical protein MRB53_033785 [Persea americana]|uniref:Uncharacterized protein n=1 Tax=Persea americana TaxID=3435 RepID=A0ACC2KW20_PERAE|nr:hypothetical protein MRB53_033785 [Persea americana]